MKLILLHTLVFACTCFWHTHLSFICYLCLSTSFPTWLWLRNSLMDIQYQVYPPSNSTWLRLPVFSLGSSYQFMAFTLKHCYSVILCFLSFFFFGPSYPTPVSLSKLLSLLPIFQSQKHISIPLFVLILTYLHFVPCIKSSIESLLNKTKASLVDHSGF